MKKTREDLPLWAKIVFETPELVNEILTMTYRKMKVGVNDNMRSKSQALEWLDDDAPHAKKDS